MKTKLLNSVLGVALGVLPFAVQGQTTTHDVKPEMVPSQAYYNDGIVSDISDVPSHNPYLEGNGVGGVQSLKVGASASTGAAFTTSAIIPFKLPVRPAGKLVVSANLSVHVNYGREWITSNVDLYGLPYNAASTINPSHHYDDAYPDAAAGITAIEDDYFAKNQAAGALDTARFEETSVSGDAALVDYLNAQYDAGAVAGDYVFLRLNVDNPATTGAHYFGIDDGSTANAPTLTIEIEADSSTGPSADYAVAAPTEDGYVSDPSVITTNNPYLWGAAKLGSSAVDGSGNLTSVIIPFMLPERPSGETVDFASMKVYVSYGRQWINSNVDLYGLTYQDALANGGTGREIFSSDHFAGDYPDASSGVTAIQDDYFTKNVAAGDLDTARWEETGQNANLMAYLNAQYDAGAVAGDWVFLRLSMDNTAMAGSQYFNIEGGDSATPATLEIGFSGTLGVEENHKSALALYPNPVEDGRLNISLEGFSNQAVLKIYAITGKLVHFEKVEASSRNYFNTHVNLNAGFYVVSLQEGNISKTQKLIVK
ncbi:T9SS type A sorting domain-containing protein [Tamlana haliotis]|uniref:T9SS type A sorting domain-containing protein n=1 Tax=Pseudotamlana haliotis TaxID=2614804 RepID=A0A6N6ME99_9FLAO|nr:T9SS type A sorting domain-containing protein [Tamlana haliotis]KAB1068069.1 T9SS type A sorting domain-containing protein [Tamlana haliotis]